MTQLPTSETPFYDLTDAVAEAQTFASSTGGMYYELGAFQPGRNTVTIGIPPNGRSVSCWMSESSGGKPFAGGAIFSTHSVQLTDNGSKIRVVFSHDWNTPLTAGVMLLFHYFG